MGANNKFNQELMTYIVNDSRLRPSHVALLAALLYYLERNPPNEFFNASRKKLMSASHIRNIVTYHKFISELVNFGYIEYFPTWHPTNGSKFKFLFKENKKSPD